MPLPPKNSVEQHEAFPLPPALALTENRGRKQHLGTESKAAEEKVCFSVIGDNLGAPC